MSNLIDDEDDLIDDDGFMDDDDLFGEFENGANSKSRTGVQVLADKHGLGGFSTMTNQEIEDFKSSSEYKQYGINTEDSENRPNNQGTTVQEILGLSNIKDSIKYSFNAFEHYDVDIEGYQAIVDTSPVMQNTLKKGMAIYPAFEYMYQDIFLSLCKYKPKLLSENEMHLSTRMNRSFAEVYLNTPEYIKLRQTCRMDEFNAALGTEIIGNKLIKIVEEVMNQINKQKEAMQKLDDLIKQEQQMDDVIKQQEDIDDILQQMQLNGQGGSTQAGLLQNQLTTAQQTMQQMKQIANKIAEEMDDLIKDDDIGQKIADLATKPFDEASLQVAQDSEIIDMWGLDGGDGKGRVPFQEKKTAIEIIRKSPKLRKLTDLIGRFKESALTEQKKKTKNGAVEISSVTTGKKIEDTLPSERMLLSNPTTKGDFYNRHSEGRLLTYSKESNKSKNKGPMVVCCDTSGSMAGDREMWSKAFTMGILEIAQLQKRDFACILYSDKASEPIIIKKDEVSPNKVIEICETFDDGGTNFERPLQKALKLIDTSTFKEADIIFITDGDCRVSDKFQEEFKRKKEDKEFTTKGILIDMGRNSASDRTLKEFCDTIDRISSVADLSKGDSEVVKNLFGAL